jgi:hypothetical protein
MTGPWHSQSFLSGLPESKGQSLNWIQWMNEIGAPQGWQETSTAWVWDYLRNWDTLRIFPRICSGSYVNQRLVPTLKVGKEHDTPCHQWKARCLALSSLRATLPWERDGCYFSLLPYMSPIRHLGILSSSKHDYARRWSSSSGRETTAWVPSLESSGAI